MKNKSKNPIRIINFNEAYERPVNKLNPRKGLIEWGSDNLYPDKTFNMYNYTGSSTSKSIINKKVKLTSGNGFQDITDVNLQKFVEDFNLEDEVKKIDLDLEIINGYAWEVIYSNDGSTVASIRHIPIKNLRRGIETEEIQFPHFWYSPDWSQCRKKGYEPVLIREYNPNLKQGKQVFVYYDYNPSMDVYPVEPYSTAMNWIEMDYEISVFHLNQLKQGYHPMFVLNFATGIPEEEELDEFYEDFKSRYKGAKNAGNIMITYSDGQDGKPELLPVQLNDSDERFAMLKDQIKEEISTAHEFPLPLIMLVAGKLSSTDERMELLREVQVSYIQDRQTSIERVLNKILTPNGYSEDLKLKEYNMEDTEDSQEAVEDENVIGNE